MNKATSFILILTGVFIGYAWAYLVYVDNPAYGTGDFRHVPADQIDIMQVNKGNYNIKYKDGTSERGKL